MKNMQAQCILVGALLILATPAAAEGLFSEGANLVLTNGEPLPPPAEVFAYENSDQFDLQVYSSMQSLSDFKITLDTPVESLPLRAQMWATHIRKAKLDRKKGKVYTCDINQDTPLFGWLFSFFKSIAGSLFKKGKEYLLYRPSSNFNAIIEVDSTDRKIHNLRIVSREDTDRILAFYGEGRCRD